MSVQAKPVRVVDAWIQPWNDVVVDALPWQTLNVLRRYGQTQADGGHQP